MDFEQSKSQFFEFSQSIASDTDRFNFFQWLREEVLPEFEETYVNGNNRVRRNSEGVQSEPATIIIEKIAADIRAQLPLDAVFKSENIIYPTVGDDCDLTSTNTVHVDAFLYDEAGEEALVQDGLLSRSYCKDCGSRNIEDLTFVTHSCSKVRLEYMFGKLLPSLSGKTVIDIGSRIGAVLFGAYFYSTATKIIGIEINADLCRLQRTIVDKYQLSDRVSVLEGDMCSMASVIRTGDVVILNNVFDWFMSPEMQVVMWRFLHSTLSPGVLLVTIPSLQSSLKSLNTGIDLSSWVTQLSSPDTMDTDGDGDQMETSEVCLYQVLNCAT